MTIDELRQRIDQLDEKLVELLTECRKYAELTDGESAWWTRLFRTHVLDSIYNSVPVPARPSVPTVSVKRGYLSSIFA